MFLLLGYGISNKSIEKYFIKNNIEFVIYDDNIEQYQKKTINFDDIHCIIKSGSFKNDHKIIIIAKLKKIEVICDIELFYRILKNNNKERRIIAVTGTNGKSTTCALIKHILPELDLCGNIGDAVFNYIDSNNDIIIEISSYMGEYLVNFKPDICVLMNIFPNHLDHHITFKDYQNAKMNIFKNMSFFDILIFKNQFDSINIVDKIDCFKINFDELISNSSFDYLINNLNDYLINYIDSVVVSIYIGFIYGHTLNTIINQLNTFKGLKYRIEKICVIDNKIEVYNDSKSTNLFSLNKALNYFNNKNILLICGGKSKEGETIDICIDNLKCVICNGDNKDTLYEYFYNNNIIVYKYDSLCDVFSNINKCLKNIDIILFSPGYQSFDQFTNFEERGKYFTDNILKLFSLN